MRHLYQCPMRWADLDLLGHVNNVVYVDYLQEARVDMMRSHGPAVRGEDDQGLVEGVVVVRHEVSYLAPLTFRFRPISIECWVTEIRAASFTLAYEIFDETPEGRVVHLRATTVLTPYVFSTERPRRLTPDERAALAPYLEETPSTSVRMAPIVPWEPGHYPLHVRFSDVDVYGHVNNVKYFEYFQEARIPLMERLGRKVGRADGMHVVVAQTDVEYKAPILFRLEPYDVNSRITYVGTKSFTIESEIRDGDVLLSRARVVLVFFDSATQRSVKPPAAYREAMLAAAQS
ncbi:thioesterase family protein [Nocardioides sp.]|uniref:acyl-CoA thioesterase n=1 Tax=Nocardioides sp. TaxID=35761 RepID=UPI002CD04F70|nr:thioesterase family protein [Nocardioides sp.]HXH79883.1 thioesterase family protein [Nocardioides sp.]